MPIDAETHLRNKRLWADTGTSEDVLPEEGTEDDLGIDDIYVEAADAYSDTAKQDAYARVIVFRRLLAPSALQGKYVQNQSSEDLTKVFDNLRILMAQWEKRVAIVSDPVESISGLFFTTAPGRRGR